MACGAGPNREVAAFRLDGTGRRSPFCAAPRPVFEAKPPQSRGCVCWRAQRCLHASIHRSFRAMEVKVMPYGILTSSRADDIDLFLQPRKTYGFGGEGNATNSGFLNCLHILYLRVWRQPSHVTAPWLRCPGHRSQRLLGPEILPKTVILGRNSHFWRPG